MFDLDTKHPYYHEEKEDEYFGKLSFLKSH